MKLIMDGKRLSFDEDELSDMLLGTGEEGSVYYYHDYALKVYHTKCGKIRLNEDACREMMGISSNYLLLPLGPLYDFHKQFVGYYTDCIHGRYVKDILKLKMKEFKERLDEVYKELGMLAQNHVYVSDLHYGNFCYDGGFFFVDPGSYSIEKDKSFMDLLTHNQGEFANFVEDYIFSDLIYGPNKKKKKEIKEHFIGYDYLLDALDREASDDETVRKYIKRIAG